MDGKPTRIQRKRTKGWRMPPSTVYVGRGTKWGNPYKIGAFDEVSGGLIDPDLAVVLFKFFWTQSTWWRLITKELTEDLRGKNLACWCPLDQPCHADVLLELANLGDER